MSQHVDVDSGMMNSLVRHVLLGSANQKTPYMCMYLSASLGCARLWQHDMSEMYSIGGGSWFFFGWDQMMDEIGFLSCLLSVTLTLYDDDAEAREFACLSNCASPVDSLARQSLQSLQSLQANGTAPPRPARSCGMQIFLEDLEETFRERLQTNFRVPCAGLPPWVRLHWTSGQKLEPRNVFVNALVK